MAVQGGMTLLAALFCGFFAIVGSLMMWANPQAGDPPPLFMGLFYGLIALVGLVMAVIQLTGSWSAYKARNYTLALIGSIVAVLSGLMCCNVLGLGLGITACVMIAVSDNEFQDPTGDLYNEV